MPPEKQRTPGHHPGGLANKLLVLTNNIIVADEHVVGRARFGVGLTNAPTRGYHHPNNRAGREQCHLLPALATDTCQEVRDMAEPTCSPSPGGGRS